MEFTDFQKGDEVFYTVTMGKGPVTIPAIVMWVNPEEQVMSLYFDRDAKYPWADSFVYIYSDNLQNVKKRAAVVAFAELDNNDIIENIVGDFNNKEEAQHQELILDSEVVARVAKLKLKPSIQKEANVVDTIINNKFMKKIASKVGYPNGLTAVKRVFSGLLKPIAEYTITKYIEQHPPKIAANQAYDTPIGLTDIPIDVNKTMPAINHLTAIYNNSIVTAHIDPYDDDYTVCCYMPTREAASNWIETFENTMKQANQYKGKCLYFDSGRLAFADVPSVNWDDVILNDKTKADIRLNTISFLGDKKLSNIGISKRGIMMYGPPGTGKTSIVKAVFKELEGKNTSRIYATAESFSYSSVQKLFNVLDYLGPTVLAFEDIDMLGTSRDVVASSGGILGDLLTNLDGMRNNQSPLVVLASTNKLSMLDEALANRPCRFDRKIEVGLPEAGDLKRLYFKHIGSDVTDEIIKLSKDFTGSHVVEAVNTATILSANTDKLKSDCLVEACNIIRANFFPEQTTKQLQAAIGKLLIKKGYIKK